MLQSKQSRKPVYDLTLEEIEQVAAVFKGEPDPRYVMPGDYVQVKRGEYRKVTQESVAIAYEHRGRDGSERGAWPAARLHPILRGNLPILFRLADLHARKRRPPPTLALRRAECLAEWKVWKGPGPSRATVHRWRKWLGMPPGEIDLLILETAGYWAVTSPYIAGVNLLHAARTSGTGTRSRT